MEPLITNRLDSALLSVVEKHGGDHEPPSRRRRPTPPQPSHSQEETLETAQHKIDDLA